MTLNRIARWLALGLAAGAAWLAFLAPAEAIPLFARQTGHNCQACHISYPELTAYGREFKLNGYTFGEAQPIPLAAAIMAEYDTISNNVNKVPAATSTGSQICNPCNHGEIVQYSIFFGGKLSENFGMFGQGTGSEFPIAGGGTAQANGAITLAADNTEFRYVHRFATGSSLEPDLVLGVDLNNALTMQDVWNAVPAWRFPWFPYTGFPSAPGPISPTIPGTFLDSAESTGHDHAGLGVYAWWHKTIYAEFTLYRQASGTLSFLNWGGTSGPTNNGEGPAEGDQPSVFLAHYAPYYRLAYSHDWGYNSVEAGVFGIDARLYDCNPIATACTSSLGATNSYRDIGIDAQYQYNKGEPWVFSAAASYIHEQNNLGASFNNPAEGGITLSTADHTINEFNIRGTAYYDRMYGVTIGYASITGSADANMYLPGTGGTTNGSPDTNFWMVELNYLPLQNLRFSLFYQAFTKLDGGSSNFDGYNNASAFNRLSGAIWWAF